MDNLVKIQLRIYTMKDIWKFSENYMIFLASTIWNNFQISVTYFVQYIKYIYFTVLHFTIYTFCYCIVYSIKLQF